MTQEGEKTLFEEPREQEASGGWEHQARDALKVDLMDPCNNDAELLQGKKSLGETAARGVRIPRVRLGAADMSFGTGLEVLPSSDQ